MEQGGKTSKQQEHVIHFSDVRPTGPTDSEIVEDGKMGRYLQLTGPKLNETVSSRHYSETEEPGFTHGIKDGLANPSTMRGRRGTEFRLEDMVDPRDQALLEWTNIEFFVPVKTPPR